MQENTITSRELMEHLGISNIKTLTRWHQQGLIPRPKIVKHPDGPGTIACWPSWVLEHCREVEKMRKKGIKISAIVDSFESDWDAVSKQYKRYRFRDEMDKKHLDEKLSQLIEKIHQLVVTNLWESKAVFHPTAQPINRQHAISALDMVKNGQNPVLVIQNGRVSLTIDIAVTEYLAKNYRMSSPLVVVPIRATVIKTFGSKGTTKRPTTVPVKSCICQARKKRVKQDFSVDKNFKVSFGKANQDRKH